MSDRVPVANTCTHLAQNRLCSTGCSCTSRLLNTILGLSATVGQHWYTSRVEQPGHTLVTWMQDRRTIQLILWNQWKQLTITPCIEELIDEGFAAKTKLQFDTGRGVDTTRRPGSGFCAAYCLLTSSLRANMGRSWSLLKVIFLCPSFSTNPHARGYTKEATLHQRTVLSCSKKSRGGRGITSQKDRMNQNFLGLQHYLLQQHPN